ncbi:UNVERIFIED_CONTAM: hypothetical protein K2H54_058454 [Gekko kuhli]
MRRGRVWNHEYSQVKTAKNATQRIGSWAGRAPKWVPPAISSLDDEDSPSLWDLVAKIEAMERAKAEKWKQEESEGEADAQLMGIGAGLGLVGQQGMGESTCTGGTGAAGWHLQGNAHLGFMGGQCRGSWVGSGSMLLPCDPPARSLQHRDVEVKASMRDDPRELKRIKHKQIDKNFDNWLLA